MVVELLSQRRELIVVSDDGKALGTVLSDERLDDGESLTRARCADNPRATEGIDDVHPALAELPLVVIAHGDVHAVFVLYLLVILQEALVFQIEAVFEQSVFQVL